MSIKIQRCFHPVGQGAFYTERFCMTGETLNVVYDCGTSTDKQNLKKIIKKTFPLKKKARKKIDYLFLSHFHSDHINGVAELLQQCDVNCVFLPLVSQENRILALLDNASLTADSFVENMILDPVGTVQSIGGHGRDGEPIVVFVPPINDTGEDFSNFDYPVAFTPEKIIVDEFSRHTIPVGLPLTFPRPLTKKVCLWCFVPYHFEFDERAKLFRQHLSHELRVSIQNIKDLPEFWRANKNDLKQAYERIRGKNRLNDTSMTLYSGPFSHKGFRESYSLLLPNYTTTSMLQPFLWMHVAQELRQIKANAATNIDLGEPSDRFSISCAEHLIRSMSPIFASITPGSRLSDKLGAFYMGDFNPIQSSVTRDKFENSGKDFMKKYSKWLRHIEIMQEAHHGSNANCSLELIRSAFNHVLSFGKKNTYGHPGLRTVAEIRKSGGCPHFVTEVPESEIVQNIEIMSDDFYAG